MNNLDNNVQIVSSKIVECNFTNIYEISGYEQSVQFNNEISFQTVLIKDSLIELVVGLKLKDVNPKLKNLKSETIFRMSLLAKFNVNKDKFEKVSNEKDDNNIKIDKSVLKKMLNITLTLLSTKLSILSSLCNFGNLEIPMILDSEKIMIKNENG